jgi:translation initiation factor IF-3
MQVKVISSEGKLLGIYNKREAIELAQSHGLDLVEINPNENPPICKIADYGKMMYEMNKNRKPEQRVETKTVQLRPVIADNDLSVKIRQIRRFLDEKNRVCLLMRFKGREIVHQEIGMTILKEVIDALGECKVIAPPSLNGKIISMTLE